MVADYLFRLLVKSQDLPIDDTFLDEHLLIVDFGETPWFADNSNWLVRSYHLI